MLLSASQIDYDQNTDVVYASGDVQIIQGDTIVLADSLIYDRAHDQVQAMGHISMLEPSGNVYFADALEFENDLKSGIIHEFKARLADDSVAVARHRTENKRKRHQAFQRRLHTMQMHGR